MQGILAEEAFIRRRSSLVTSKQSSNPARNQPLVRQPFLVDQKEERVTMRRRRARLRHHGQLRHNALPWKWKTLQNQSDEWTGIYNAVLWAESEIY